METNIMISNHNKHLWPFRHSEQVTETIHVVCKFFLTAPEALIKQIPYRKKKTEVQYSVPSTWSQVAHIHFYKTPDSFILDAISTAEFMRGCMWYDGTIVNDESDVEMVAAYFKLYPTIFL